MISPTYIYTTQRQYARPITMLIALLLLLASCGTRRQLGHASAARQAGSALSDSFFFKGIKYKMLGKYAEAAAQFDSFSSMNPTEPAAWYEAARLYATELRRSNKAMEYARKAYELNRGSEKYYDIFYGDLLGNNEQPKKAAKIFAALAQKEAYPEEYLLRESFYYKEAKEYDKSLGVLAQIEAAGYKDSNDVDMLRLQVLLEKNDTEGTQKILKSLRERNADNLQYTLVMAGFYLSQKEQKKADEIFQDIVYHKLSEGEKAMAVSFALESPTPDNLYFLAHQVFVENAADTALALSLNYNIMHSQPSLEKLVRYKDAAFRVAQEAEASPVATYVLINYYNAFDQPDSAYNFALKGVKQYPKDDFFQLQVFDYFFRKSQPDSVIAFSNQLLASDSTRALALYGKGLAYIIKKEPSVALPYMQKAIDNGRAHFTKHFLSEIFLHFGDIYHEQKQAEKSYQAYDSALYYNSNNAGALNNYAYFLSVANTRLKFAEELSEKSLILAPESPSFLDTYGWIKYQLGDYDEAAKYIRRAIDLSEQPTAELWEHLAEVELKLGSKENAVKYWEIAIEAGGDAEMLQQKIINHGKK